ncbi:hypothetical protein BUALT_Bualt01G0154400 [Buddleja alternifolia]|uniref:Preprotein translocase subunit SecE n=1 Tax=Buddleja alternifolia TaxID=168488 RepID=A0AAV6YBI6_9LAMI|nr:hypothetical protein BUALT_Bualt01G0154400 [Buddleja alternifolia]
MRIEGGGLEVKKNRRVFGCWVFKELRGGGGGAWKEIMEVCIALSFPFLCISTARGFSRGINTLAIGSGYPKLPFQNHRPTTAYKFSKIQTENISVSRKNSNIQIPYFRHRCSGTTHILSAGRKYHLSYNDDSHAEPFWLNLMRDTIWSVRNLLQFLLEQPGQLKYIEWPSFQSTLKTATLTLVLVAVLIVALSSVDSALSYLLALYLRRKA